MKRSDARQFFLDKYKDVKPGVLQETLVEVAMEGFDLARKNDRS